MVLIFLLLFFVFLSIFLDLFYFLISLIIVLSHLIFMSDLIIILLITICFVFNFFSIIGSFALWFSWVCLLQGYPVSWLESQVLNVNLIWLWSFLGSFLFYFLVSSFNIRLLGLQFFDFFHFLFYEVISISYPGNELVKLTPVDSRFFFNVFFFSFVFHCLVFLRPSLHWSIFLWGYLDLACRTSI